MAVLSEVDLRDWKDMGWHNDVLKDENWKACVEVPVEKDPHGKDPKEKGSKLDAGKSPIFRGLLDYFPRACSRVANVSRVGAAKYAWKGWESVPDGFMRYSDALGRHLLKESIEGEWDTELEDVRHAEQVAWNAFARLEILLQGQK